MVVDMKDVIGRDLETFTCACVQPRKKSCEPITECGETVMSLGENNSSLYRHIYTAKSDSDTNYLT